MASYPKKGDRGVVAFPGGAKHSVIVSDIQEDGSGLVVRKILPGGQTQPTNYRLVRGKDGVYRTPVAGGVLLRNREKQVP